MTVLELDVAGPAAPPRSNGELVFAQPWEGRAFGLAMTLSGSGVLSYDDFRVALIGRIRAWEATHTEGEKYFYYRCWLEALVRVLDEKSLVAASDVTERAAALSARPAGHDHGDHHHDQ